MSYEQKKEAERWLSSWLVISLPYLYTTALTTGVKLYPIRYAMMIVNNT